MGKFKLRLEWGLQGKPVVFEVETKKAATMYLVVDHLLAVIELLRKMENFLTEKEKKKG